MISLQTKNAYSEVFELMKFIDRNDLNKIPMEVLITIKENRNEEYMPKIDLKNINQSLNKDALCLYIWLYKTYIAKDKNEVQAINKILYDNENKKNKEIKYDFFNKTNDNKESKTEESKELVVYKESFIKKIVNKLKEVFKSGGKKSGN